MLYLMAYLISIYTIDSINIPCVNRNLIPIYFEDRENNDLSLFEYSKDKKREKELIFIGQVMASEVLIHHEI
ncbi:MAG: hypothetical protein QW783_03125 [Candidatus Micrarchaeia archaeon]